MAFNLFKLKGPKKTEDRVKISYDIAHLPAFKYFGNAKSVFKENIDGKKCLCCGKISKYIYTGPFYYKPQNNIVPFETVDNGLCFVLIVLRMAPQQNILRESLLQLIILSRAIILIAYEKLHIKRLRTTHFRKLRG